MNKEILETTQDQQTQDQPKLKTWDEAIKELGSFIIKSKQEENKDNIDV